LQTCIALLLFTANQVPALWVQMTMQELVDRSDLILVGKLVKIKNDPESGFDIGIIQVSRVIKGKDSTKEVRLQIPSRNRDVQVSTDLIYGIGQKGLWFLRLKRPGGNFSGNLYLADHPQRFQQETNVEKVLKYLTKQ